MKFLVPILACVLLACASLRAQGPDTGTGSGLATSATDPASSAGPSASTGSQAPFGPAPQSPTTTSSGSGPSLSFSLAGGSTDRKNLGSALEIVLLMTLLSMAPALVMTMTSFTRIIIVLSFLKRAMSIQELPPRMVVTGFALFMTIFIMTPVVSDIYDSAYEPYVAETIEFSQAAEIASDRMAEFMLRQTRAEDIELILSLSKSQRPATPQDVPFHVIVPAFILSEIKTAFQMGFVLFLPFIAIDLVISSILISMGMFTLPPIVVSTPLKLLLFILVDGWNLVVGSLAQSFAQS
ncbi:MAG: flagellar type III secretion system pore protein FliP [Planctomycetes bacterium]|nr:flagellar type III secretion system pore protein FliP [Planctomycetota bacterium]